MDKSTTDFGFKQVEWEEKEQLVDKVFSSVASKYDIMNDLMSFGIHRLWKKIALSHCAVRPGQHVLDLAGGTGDLAREFAKVTDNVTLADINADMLKAGRVKLVNSGFLRQIKYAQVNAEQLPFTDNHFDCVIIGFGLRNVTDKQAALSQMFRVLKPGGKMVILEFSKPSSQLLSSIYDAYSFKALPFLGKLIANDSDSYQYLAESIRMHPDQDTLQSMIEDAGFERTSYQNLTGGICAIHKGFKF